MSNYDDDTTGRRTGYGDDSGGYGGTTGSRGDDSYGVQHSTHKASEAGLISSLQSSGPGGLGGGDSYGSSGRSGIGGDDSFGSSGRGGDDSYGSNERSGSSGFGSGTTGGAGSGNKYTSGAQDSGRLDADYGTGHSGDTTDRHEAYSGQSEYGSGSVGGAGFGNKSSGGTTGDSSFGGNPDVARNSDPYSGRNEYGSGSTGGAGFGNKSSKRDDDDSKGNDSTSGKLMEKVGGMFGNEKMKEKGMEKREQAGYGDNSGSGGYGGISTTSLNFGGDRNAAAVNTYKMEVETAALIRAAEDILSLTRVMKEMWLFGKLQTVGTNEAEARAEESANGVEEGLRKLKGGGGAEI
ncbi:MAG: hypothetical protein Q9170_007928 [Blastenia crenularia]